MAKDDIKLGRELQFEYNSTVVGRVVSFNLSVDGNVVDVSDFDSGEFNEYLRGRKSWTVSLTAHRVEGISGSQAQDDITSDFVSGTASGSVTLGPVTPQTGDVTYSGDVYVTNFSVDASDSDDAVESSWEFQGTGQLSRSVQA